MDKKPATAKVLTDEEKWEIKENGKYILTAMNTIGKNGDAYCTDESLFRVSKKVRPDLTKQQFYTDKSLLLQAAFLHQEGCHLYAQRTWEYEVTAAEQLADILKDPALPVMEIPKELRAGDILLSEQQRKAIGLALNSRLAVILGGAGLGLSLVWEIANLHGGSVWVEESSDKGTTIAVELPAGAENDSPGADIP